MPHRLLVAAVLSISLALPLQSAVKAPARVPSRPTLVVVLVVDQMRGDYVLKYGHQWTGGLRRLIDGGAWFQNAVYPYVNTVTCAGHATISTGAFPRTHGIIGNGWWDRASETMVECASNPDQQTVSDREPVREGVGARRLAISTLTDELRAQSPVAPRIVTFSLKERTAVMLAGHRATAATWFDTAARRFVTSSAYALPPVPFIERFVKDHPVDADLGATWTARRAPGFYAFADAADGERPPSYWTATFPHALKRDGMKPRQPYDAWKESPFSDAYLEALGESAIEALDLGRGPGTDYLGISFSALDLVGHDFGPQSHEVQDVLLRLDERLASLFTLLDRRVGRARYVVALAADHGVSPIPEQMAAAGIPAGRISTSLMRQIDEWLQPGPGTRTSIARANDGQVYLTAAALDALSNDRARRQQLLARLERNPGVARALLTSERAEWDQTDPLARAARYDWYPDRTGDIVLIQQPYWLPGNGSAAGHGSPYRYDTWVPVFLYGHGIRPGRYGEPITPADIAPTLARLCGLTLPHADGRPLLEALAPAPRPATPSRTDPHPTR